MFIYKHPFGGLPIAVLEAMALQTSSSLNIIGNKDVVISGETGFFV
jgi:hypothetical protein